MIDYIGILPLCVASLTLVIGLCGGAILWKLKLSMSSNTEKCNHKVIRYKTSKNTKVNFCDNRGYAVTQNYRYDPNTNILGVKLFEVLTVPDGLALIVTQLPRDTRYDATPDALEYPILMFPNTHVITSGVYYDMFTLVEGYILPQEDPTWISQLEQCMLPLAFNIKIISTPIHHDLTKIIPRD